DPALARARQQLPAGTGAGTRRVLEAALRSAQREAAEGLLRRGDDVVARRDRLLGGGLGEGSGRERHAGWPYADGRVRVSKLGFPAPAVAVLPEAEVPLPSLSVPDHGATSSKSRRTPSSRASFSGLTLTSTTPLRSTRTKSPPRGNLRALSSA